MSVDEPEIEPPFEQLPPAVQLERSIDLIERRARNSYMLAHAPRTERGQSVGDWHMMNWLAFEVVLPHLRKSLEDMKVASRPQLPTDPCPHIGCAHTRASRTGPHIARTPAGALTIW